MNVQAYADFLLSHMANAKYASGRKFINCRCPECGDSMHLKSAHMYIFIPWDEDEASWYYCHKCHASSIMTYKKLLEWDIFDQTIASDLQELNTKVARNPKKSKYFNKEIYTVKHSFVTQNDKTEFKRQYVCDRLGYDFTCDDLARLKVILNLNDILYENNITKLTRNPNIVEQLSNEFIGFLSIDNAFLNMRKTCPDGIVYSGIDKRYINYQIYDKTDTTQRFYCVPTKVNLNTTERIKFHISEGPFDILSVFLNVRKGESGIYTCVAGSNYTSVIMFFLIDMRLPNIELHFYPDNDEYGTDSAIWKIVNRIPDPTIPVYVHRNIQPGEKDFGVTPDRIKESITVLRKSIT
jgi:hypothetical protein